MYMLRSHARTNAKSRVEKLESLQNKQSVMETKKKRFERQTRGREVCEEARDKVKKQSGIVSKYMEGDEEEGWGKV